MLEKNLFFGLNEIKNLIFELKFNPSIKNLIFGLKFNPQNKILVWNKV